LLQCSELSHFATLLSHFVILSAILLHSSTIFATAPATYVSKAAFTPWQIASVLWSSTAMGTKLPPLTLFLSDMSGNEPLVGGECVSMVDGSGSSDEYPTALTPVGAILLPLLEPWRRPTSSPYHLPFGSEQECTLAVNASSDRGRRHKWRGHDCSGVHGSHPPPTAKAMETVGLWIWMWCGLGLTAEVRTNGQGL
jgi:hypothetical protein